MENYDVYLPSNEEKPEPIFESYYGKLPEFEMIENLFEGMISKGRKEKNKANPNKYSENKEVCKILKKVFGFKDAFLYWIPSNSVNAYTVTVHSLMIFGESKDFIEKRSDKGFYDNSHRSVLTVYLYTGILDEKVDLTPAELLSIVLHEIGHNFDYSPYHTITFFIDSILTMGEYSVYVANNKRIEDLNHVKTDEYNKIKEESERIYKDQSLRDENAKKYEKAMERYVNQGWGKGIKKLIQYNLLHILAFPVAPLFQLIHLGDHMGEQFADSFATAYGYGTELISGLDKLTAIDIPEKRTKGLQVLEDLNEASFEIFSGMNGDVHGTHQERAKSCIKKLKADLKKEDFPPELKEELQNEINKLEDRYRKLITATPDDKLRITKIWRRVCNFLFNGANNFYKFFKRNQV